MRSASVILIVALVVTSILGTHVVQAKGRNVRALCLARAGVTEQQWQQRRATYAQGAVVKICMTEHGQDFTVRRRDGSILY